MLQLMRKALLVNAAPIRVISAQNLAKARYEIHERKEMSAEWILGRLEIEERTETLAARVFSISPPSVHAALAELDIEPASAADFMRFWWDRATPAQRENFVRSDLLSIWDLIECITR
jgi:hypothetical protein